MLASSSPTQIAKRLEMVLVQLCPRGISSECVLRAMRDVPRHEFVPERYREEAYNDKPLPIGHGQTISQPYMVAVMTEAIDPKPTDCVLEIGTGSGYHSMVLAKLVARVVSFEWVPELANDARQTLKRLGVENVDVITGDGSCGSFDEMFDGIIVAAGAPKTPPLLPKNLVDGGRLVIPIGVRTHQMLTVVRRMGGRFEEVQREGCVFVPLQGECGW